MITTAASSLGGCFLAVLKTSQRFLFCNGIIPLLSPNLPSDNDQRHSLLLRCKHILSNESLRILSLRCQDPHRMDMRFSSCVFHPFLHEACQISMLFPRRLDSSKAMGSTRQVGFLQGLMKKRIPSFHVVQPQSHWVTCCVGSVTRDPPYRHERLLD